MSRFTSTPKPLIAGLAVTLALSSGLVSADYDGRYAATDFADRAKVVSSTPVYERINEPRRECRTEYRSYEERSYRNDNNTGNAVLGAIVGGLVGSTIGKGTGRVAASAVGAATGAVIGDRWNDRDGGYTTTRTRPVETCRMIDSFRDEVVGYDVIYRYQGKEFSTRLPYNPGEWLDVNVSVTTPNQQPYSRDGGGWYRD